MITESDFRKRVAEHIQKYPHWRYGQAVFCLMYQIAPHIADRLRGTEFDPFYDDKKADHFILTCFSYEDFPR